MDKIILKLSSYTQVYGAQQILSNNTIRATVRRATREMTGEDGCGYVLMFERSQQQKAFDVLARAGYRYKIVSETSRFWGGGQ